LLARNVPFSSVTVMASSDASMIDWSWALLSFQGMFDTLAAVMSSEREIHCRAPLMRAMVRRMFLLYRSGP
jgi:hypothetical protein